MKRLITHFALLTIAIMSVQTFTTQAQSLDVQSRPVNNGSVLPNNGVRVPFLQLALTAQATPVTVKSITVSRSGLSSNDDIGRVWLTDDFGVRLTRARQFNNDSFLTLELSRGGYTIPAFTTQVWTVVANLEFEGSGRTLSINLEDIETGTSLSSSFFNQSNQRQVQPSIRSFQSNTDRNFSLNSEITDTQSISQSSTNTPRRRFTYDKEKYRVKCRNSRCQLVLR